MNDTESAGTDKGDYALDLSPGEATALAWRIVAQHLATDIDWLLWSDFPYLSEQAFISLCESVDGVIRTASRLADAQGDTDSRFLLEQAKNGGSQSC